MVKKIIYGGAVAALITSSAVFAGGPEILPPPVYFQGFYVGGTVGGHAAKVDQTANFSSTTDPYTINVPGFGDTPVLISNTSFANADLNAGDINAYGGVQGGVNWVWDSRWLIGIVGFWEGSHGLYANSSETQGNTFVSTTGPATPAETTVANTSNLTLNTQTKIGNDWGVAGKIGMLLSPTTLVYAKLGAIWADITTSASVNGTIAGRTDVVSGEAPDTITSTLNTVTNVNGSTNNSEDDEVAFLVGAGLEQYVYSNVVTFFIEYNYAQFDNVSSGPVGVTSTTSATTSVDGGATTAINSVDPVTNATSISANTNKVRFNNVLAGFNFYFGQNWL